MRNAAALGRFLPSRSRPRPLAWLVGLLVCLGHFCVGAAAAQRPAANPPCVPAAELTSPAPVLRHDFPDAFVLCFRGVFYGFATNSGGINVQLARSRDLKHWRLVRGRDGAQADALPVLPAWVDPTRDRSDVWAPEVLRVGRRYVLYFSARHRLLRTPVGQPRECIGTAVSDRPDRGFVADPAPLICTAFPEGVIDASPFRDRGRIYLDFKSDGNCCGLPARLLVSELTLDGRRLRHGAKQLGVTNDRCWEGAVVEAPTMVRRGRGYDLFYSSGDFGRGDYSVAYAACRGPTGPCTKPARNRLLTSSAPGIAPPLAGPGHQSVLTVGGRMFLTYHALTTDARGHASLPRFLHVDELGWEDGKPRVRLPRRYAPAPATCG